MTARTWTPEELLNHQALWTAFLQRLSHHDPEYDLEVIRSFAECIGVPPQKVWFKFKSQVVRTDPPRSIN
jgi:hypothetical protein